MNAAKERAARPADVTSDLPSTLPLTFQRIARRLANLYGTSRFVEPRQTSGVPRDGGNARRRRGCTRPVSLIFRAAHVSRIRAHVCRKRRGKGAALQPFYRAARHGRRFGLEVAALDGAPGVHSARYAGAEASQAQRNAKLQEELRRASTDRRAAKNGAVDRSARFVCVIAVAHGTRGGGAFKRRGGEILEGPVARADSVTIPCSFSRRSEKRLRR